MSKFFRVRKWNICNERNVRQGLQIESLDAQECCVLPSRKKYIKENIVLVSKGRFLTGREEREARLKHHDTKGLRRLLVGAKLKGHAQLMTQASEAYKTQYVRAFQQSRVLRTGAMYELKGLIERCDVLVCMSYHHSMQIMVFCI